MLACLLVIAALFSGCASALPRAEEPAERGWVSLSLFREPLYEAFQAGYDTARVTEEFIPLLRSAKEGVTVTVFFGGWCSDSKREVPRFLKVAHAAGMADSTIRLYALDRTKKSADGLTEKFGIEKVPTFIVFKREKEVGRITESPTTSMEADLLTIFAGAGVR